MYTRRYFNLFLFVDAVKISVSRHNNVCIYLTILCISFSDQPVKIRVNRVNYIFTKFYAFGWI